MTFGTLASAPHRTKQEFVYRTLREAILRCELQPGERLVIDDLARRLNVSIIPVREALQLLQAESLVQVIPHVGTSVTPVSRDSIIDVFTVLEGLEVSASRLVAERGRDSDLALLGGQVEAMEAALVANDREEWAALNRRFHLTISELPGLDMVKDLTSKVLDRWDRLRRFYFKGVLANRVEQAQQEHQQILDAMRTRDMTALQTLVRQHNQGALLAYLSFLDASEPVRTPEPIAAHDALRTPGSMI
ncbi:MAG: GntR family transcriptional regulator [Vicinamibacteraceae bacterium]